MASARTECPYCHGDPIEALDDIVRSANDDYFGCKDCRRVWNIPKGKDGPPSPPTPPRTH
jgi:hypothetical protein